MYLVELRPGREELYRSSDELALAIRSGDVDERSRVYHRATAKWISITLHPQYKAIVAAAREEPASRPARRWTILGGGAQSTEPGNGDATASAAQQLYRWRRPLALGVAALLLLSGLQLAFSGPRPPWAGHQRIAAAAPKPANRAVLTQPTNTSSQSELVSLASTRTAWSDADMADSFPIDHSRIESGAVPLPHAPRLRTKLLSDALAGAAQRADASTLDALFARYAAAHDSAESRLEAGMRLARLTGLFTASRLSPTGGVTDTRMSLAGAANFIRVFRQQQKQIEQTYQDSVTLLAKQNQWTPKQIRKWYARPQRKESPTLELISGSLVASIDSLLGVLDAQAGAYKIRGTAIAFEDPTAGQAYGALRRRIKEQVDAAIAAGGGISSGPTGLLLQAIGTTTLPRET
ncbi:MAG TPA: hypothetical protein VIG95_06185 [Gemmatimonadales bacterium]